MAVKVSRGVRSVAAFRSWETRREHDEFVAVNIPADMLPLWERSKLQFKGSPESRLEAFMAYAHDHEVDGIAAVIDEADAKLDAMISEYQGRAAYEVEVEDATLTGLDVATLIALDEARIAA